MQRLIQYTITLVTAHSVGSTSSRASPFRPFPGRSGQRSRAWSWSVEVCKRLLVVVRARTVFKVSFYNSIHQYFETVFKTKQSPANTIVCGYVGFGLKPPHDTLA